MKICIIGNSHVGALKRAWDTISPAYPGLEMVFFAHRGNGMAALKRQGKQLVPTSDALAAAIKFTSGGLDRIVPNDYDAFLIYGLRASPNFGDNDRFFSRQVRQQAVEDLTGNTLSLRILKMVRQLTDTRIYLGHDPLNSASADRPDASNAPYESGIAILNDCVYGPLGAEMLMQPLSTVVNGRNTDASFSQNSQRLAISTANREEKHSEGEDKHMNEAFGEIWLTAFIARLNSQAATLSTVPGAGRRKKRADSPANQAPDTGTSSPWSKLLKRAGLQ
jgi:hypothetical protein